MDVIDFLDLIASLPTSQAIAITAFIVLAIWIVIQPYFCLNKLSKLENISCELHKIREVLEKMEKQNRRVE